MNGFYESFLGVWHVLMEGGIFVAIAFSIGIFIYHMIRTASLKSSKEKYDYISRSESKIIFYSILGFAIAAGMAINLLKPDTVALAPMWFFIRLFIGICIGTLIGYVSYLIIKYTYPTSLGKKLNRLRYTPRVNPKTGNQMRLLSEEEEDVHLDEGMQAEENVFSVDYDVWIDDTTGDTVIEKYPGHLQALECDRCGFRTLKLEREEITKPVSDEEEGELIKHYKCSYCSRIKRQTKKIAKLSESGKNFKVPLQSSIKDVEEVQVVKSLEIKIYSAGGLTKIYDFQTIQQAKNFLEEFVESEAIEE